MDLPPLPAPKRSGRHTHMHKQNKLLKHIPEIINPVHLTTVYLYNNEIEKIEGLEAAVNIVTLYLQQNRIKIIENLHTLKKLQKLYLGHNQITVVENLEANILLQELNLEKQNIKKSECMCFDPRSIFALSASLQVLNVTGNNIRSLYGLMPLSALRILHAGKNKLTEIYDVLETIQFWYYLYEANFAGNPVTKKHRFRELLIGHTMRLNLLDGKQISPTTRTFIRNFEEEIKNKTHNVNLSNTYPDLPTNYSTALQEAVSSTIIKTGLSDLTVTSHIPWKQLPKRMPSKKSNLRHGGDAKSTPDNRSLFPMNL
ncbi:protein phosphatase 1 regulatory subunit 42-like [Atheta coriaria]|uniref:protein phosphatase 1 regulatory subunit 42-like n=1 Tax=Dalotia coriaria TaxID=877792 RepID=UPI0031F3B2FC